MKKLTRIEFVKEYKEFIKKTFNEIIFFIDQNDEIFLRTDQESFRMKLINYLYNIYLNE